MLICSNYTTKRNDLSQRLCQRMWPSFALQALFRHVTQQLDESAPPKTRAAAGRDWVRGWDDSWRWVPYGALAASNVRGISSFDSLLLDLIQRLGGHQGVPAAVQRWLGCIVQGLPTAVPHAACVHAGTGLRRSTA